MAAASAVSGEGNAIDTANSYFTRPEAFWLEPIRSKKCRKPLHTRAYRVAKAGIYREGQ